MSCGHCQVLSISIDCDALCTLHSNGHQALDCVVASTSTPDYDNSGLSTVKMCVAYEIDGERVDHMPYHQSEFHEARPIYEELPGWETDITDCRTADDLPANAKTYVELIEEQVGVPVSVIGVGPGRRQFVQWSG